jgi:glycosyltransferase involved in cell wall biosynthesis
MELERGESPGHVLTSTDQWYDAPLQDRAQVMNGAVGASEELESSTSDVQKMMLSIVMASYNESRTLADAINQVLDTPFPCPIELIVVDDGSYDGTSAVLARVRDPRVVIHRHPSNLGKGAAILSGIALARGTHVVPFDADLEYAPQDLLALVEPILSGRAEIVYGPRLFGTNTVYQSYRYALGNKVTTFVANVLFDSYISDLHTCLKLVPTQLVRNLSLRERGFGLDTELTAELLRLGHRPFEVPVSYHSRTRSQGKKIDWRDGFSCLVVLVRVRSRGKKKQRIQSRRRNRSGELQLLARSGR